MEAEEMTPVERCLWRQIDAEAFQEIWDEVLNEWGTLESEITEDFPIGSVILQVIKGRAHSSHHCRKWRTRCRATTRYTGGTYTKWCRKK